MGAALPVAFPAGKYVGLFCADRRQTLAVSLRHPGSRRRRTHLRTRRGTKSVPAELLLVQALLRRPHDISRAARRVLRREALPRARRPATVLHFPSGNSGTAVFAGGSIGRQASPRPRFHRGGHAAAGSLLNRIRGRRCAPPNTILCPDWRRSHASRARPWPPSAALGRNSGFRTAPPRRSRSPASASARRCCATTRW